MRNYGIAMNDRMALILKESKSNKKAYVEIKRKIFVSKRKTKLNGKKRFWSQDKQLCFTRTSTVSYNNKSSDA